MGGNTIIFIGVAAFGAYLGATWARAERARFDVRRTLANLSALRSRQNKERGRLILMIGGVVAVLYLFVRNR